MDPHTRGRSRDSSTRKRSRDRQRSRSPDKRHEGKRQHLSGQEQWGGRHTDYSNNYGRGQDNYRRGGQSHQVPQWEAGKTPYAAGNWNNSTNQTMDWGSSAPAHTPSEVSTWDTAHPDNQPPPPLQKWSEDVTNAFIANFEDLIKKTNSHREKSKRFREAIQQGGPVPA